MTRKLSGKSAFFVLIFSATISLIHFWYNSFGLITVVSKSMLHLSLMMSLVFLKYPAFKNSPKNRTTLGDWFLFTLSLIQGIIFLINYPRIGEGIYINKFDLIFGALFILLIIEASRRVVGLPLTLLGITFLLYTYYGPYMPGIFIHGGYVLRRIIIRMSMTSEGALGIVAIVSSTYIFMFILFGSFLSETKASEFFNNLALAISGRSRGGPAKVAMIASALTGTINGSAVANVVTTGSFTIPLMKSIGYKPYFAAAVESASSLGGVFLPPIMGAAAFIMSSFLGISYLKIALAGATPAILYYFAIYQMIDLGALKWGLSGIKKEELPNLKEVMMKRGYLLTPIFMIIIFLILGYTPLFTAWIGIISCFVVSFIKKDTRLTLKKIVHALSEGAQDAASIAIICGLVGFIVGAMGMTGLGQSIGNYIVHFAQGKLFLTALFVMVTAVILGMGLPGAACYIITSTIAAPALVVLNVSQLSAHFFAFYFGSMSAVIPPVAITSFAAATIAKANTNKTALYGLFLGIAGLILPFMFIYNPVILLQNFTWVNYLFSVLSLTIALYATAITIMGVLREKVNYLYRGLFFFAAVLLVIPELSFRLSGYILFIVTFLFSLLKAKKTNFKI